MKYAVKTTRSRRKLAQPLLTAEPVDYTMAQAEGPDWAHNRFESYGLSEAEIRAQLGAPSPWQ